MNKPLKVLIVEDSESDAKLALRALRRGGFDPTFRRVQTAAELETVLAQERWDAVLSDFNMPGFTGMDALKVFRSAGLDIPFILISGTIGEETAVEAMKAGASDYVMKNSLARLAPALERELKETQMRAAHRRAQRELIESEQRLRTIIETQPACVKVVNKEGVLLDMNAAGLAMLEAGSLAAVKSQALIEFILPEYRAAFAALHQRVMRGESGILEFEVIGLKGGRRWLETHAAPMAGANGEVAMLLGITRDITERKEAAGRIAYLNRIYAVLSGINSTLIRVRNRQELFQESCQIIVEQGQFPFAWIGILDHVTQDVTPVAWAGTHAETLTRGKSSARDDVQEGKGAVGQAIRTRRAVFNNDITAGDVGGPRRQEVLRLGFQSQFTLPLFENQSVIGTLTMYARETNFFDQEELRLLEGLAGNISFALENIAKQQKFEKLSRIRAVSSEINAAIVRIRERDALLRETCRIAVEHGKFDFVWVALLDEEKKKVDPLVWSGFSPEAAHSVTWERVGSAHGTLHEAIQTRKPSVRNDIQEQHARGMRSQEAMKAGCHSTVCLPVVVDDRVAAAIALFAIGRDFFDEDELVLLNEVAGNISFALEHIENEKKIARLSRIQAVTGNINALIVRARDRQELFDEVCRIAVEHGGFVTAWIGAFDPSTLEVVPVAWSGPQLHPAGVSARTSVLRGQGAVSRAITEKRPVFDNDIAASSSMGGERRELAIQKGLRSLVALPFLVEGSVVGHLSLYVKEPDFFTENELKLLTGLAEDISFAVGNIAKQQKLEKLSRIRAVSSEINAAIIRIRDREALLRETCRIAAEHGKFEMVWIALLDQEKQKVEPVAWIGFTPEIARAVNWSSINAAQGTLGEATRTRKPAVRNDIETDVPVGGMRGEALKQGCRSAICLPLMVDDNVVALIALFGPGAGFFDEQELALLDEVTSNISFALAHIEKEEKIARLSRIQAVMSSINALIVRVRDRQELFDQACRIAVEHGGFGIAWIGTLDPHTLDVKPVAHAGLQANDSLINFKSSASVEHPLGRGVVGQAIRARAPVFVADLSKEPGAGERRKEAVRRGYYSRIALPLLVDDCVVGVMVLFARERAFFNEEELKLLSELAGDISFALEHIGKETKLNYLAYYDALTGLPNRTLFEERLSRLLHAAGENGTKVAVLLGNVNRFRFINESLGRQFGDALLRELAARVKKIWPDPDNVARISGDSFGGIVADLKDETELAHVPEPLVTGVTVSSFKIENEELTIAMTAGIAVFPTDGKDADTLFRNAEVALKRAKASGERYLFYRPEMNARVAETLQLENKLRQALDREEFVLHYQPKVDLAKGTISGLEALIRWNDPETGLVPPMKFIPLLEETGMILEAGRWAMQKAVADYREWHTQGLQPPRIAVNVSPIQLRQKDFVEVVRNVIGGAEAGPHGLDLEITESLLMEDIEGNIEKLRAVRDMGVNIAIDDFGTGYSSLRYLAKLPVNALKIDRSFIITMTGSADSMTIVSTIISLAHALKLKVIAEGVDAEEQRKFLRLLKCDEMQGYLFSRPVPGDDVLALLQADSPVPA